MVEVAAMFFRQSMSSTVHIATLALNPQKTQFPVAVEASLLILLLLPDWNHWYFFKEVGFPAGGSDLGPWSSDW